MKVLLNGSSYSVENNCSVDSLIKNLELDGKYAIEINQNIIPRSQYTDKKINQIYLNLKNLFQKNMDIKQGKIIKNYYLKKI